MNNYTLRFQQLMLIGIVLILFFALPAIFIPNSVIRFFGGEPAVQALWPAFAGLLLVLLTLFFIPALTDPLRYPTFAWLIVATWAGIMIFFLILWPSDYGMTGYGTAGYGRGIYKIAGYVSLLFAVLGGALLVLARRTGSAAHS